VFATELQTGPRILALLPGAGTTCARAGVAGVRRVYVPKVACHVYYTFDAHEVIVRAFWGALRRHGPRIEL
jgi:hypothetical protein